MLQGISYSKLRQQVMRRVYAIWFLRLLCRGACLKVFGLALILWQLSAYISFRHVLANVRAVSGLASYPRFWLSALTHTELVSQFLLLGFLILVGWLVKDSLVLLSRRRFFFNLL